MLRETRTTVVLCAHFDCHLMICEVSCSFDLCNNSYKNLLLLSIYLKLNEYCTLCCQIHSKLPKKTEESNFPTI
jgi:hypothetical protein